MLKVKLLAHTPNADRVVSESAKLCYSQVGIEEIDKNLTDEQINKFLTHLVNIGHESPTEHVSFTFGVEGISRCCANQIVRHRIGSYCLSGDTIIGYDNKIKGLTIKELYEKAEQYKNMVKLRSVNEDTQEIILNNIENIIYSGKKKVFEVVTKDGYIIKATNMHKFYTDNGWKRLKDIKIGDKVYTNGIEAYKNKTWLNTMYNNFNFSQKQIAELCNVSYHTIRSWVRKFNLQKEIGSWSIGVEPVNKGKTKDDYEPLKRVSKKMKGNHNGKDIRGEHNPMYKDNIEDLSISGGYFRTHKNKSVLGVCEICGKKTEETEVHHIDRNPKNYNDDNLIELCKECHKRQHFKTGVKCIKLSEIISIKELDYEDTYDIEMKAPYHNFIANGFVVHNSQQSQRYVKLEQFEYIVPPEIEKNEFAKKIFIKHMEQSQEAYNEIFEKLMIKELDEKYPNWDDECTIRPDLINSSIEEVGYYPREWYFDSFRELHQKEYNKIEKKCIEDARYVFPNACETKIVITMNARSLMNFFTRRCCDRSQWEIRALANEMLKQVKEVAPILFKNAGATCVRGACPEGSMSCGNPKRNK